MTFAPRYFATWMPALPRPPDAPITSTQSPDFSPAMSRSMLKATGAWRATAVATGNRMRARDRDFHILRIPAPDVQAEYDRKRVHSRRPHELQRHDAIAAFARARAGSDRGDDAGRIDAEHVRELDRHRVRAGPHDEVERAVHRHRADLDEHLARLRHGRRHFLEAHHFGRPEFADDDGLHGSRATGSRG